MASSRGRMDNVAWAPRGAMDSGVCVHHDVVEDNVVCAPHGVVDNVASAHGTMGNAVWALHGEASAHGTMGSGSSAYVPHDRVYTLRDETVYTPRDVTAYGALGDAMAHDGLVGTSAHRRTHQPQCCTIR